MIIGVDYHPSFQTIAFLMEETDESACAWDWRCNPDWRRRYIHLTMRRHKNIAKAAMARKLAVRFFGSD